MESHVWPHGTAHPPVHTQVNSTNYTLRDMYSAEQPGSQPSQSAATCRSNTDSLVTIWTFGFSIYQWPQTATELILTRGCSVLCRHSNRNAPTLAGPTHEYCIQIISWGSEKHHTPEPDAISLSILSQGDVTAHQPPSEQPAMLPCQPIRNAQRIQKTNCTDIVFVDVIIFNKIEVL